MNDYQKLYAEKLTTPEGAVEAHLRSGMVCGTDIALAHAPRFYEAVGKAIQDGKLENITQHSTSKYR